MKKTLTFLMVLLTIPVLAQKNYIGIKSGINSTNVISNNFLDNLNYKQGFTSGLTYEYQFKNKFHLELNLIYCQYGFKEDHLFFTNGEIATKKYSYNYMSFPLKGGWLVGKHYKGFFNLGIVPSTLLKAELVAPTFSGEAINDLTDYVTKIDFAGLLEVGRNFTLNEQLIMFTSFIYQPSFTSITNEQYYPDSIAKHYALSLSVGLKYSL